MEDIKTLKNLKDILLAALISEGYRDLTSQQILRVPFPTDKIFYLAEIIGESKLIKYIEVNVKKGEFIITCPEELLKDHLNQWYRDNKKIFSDFLDPTLITLNSIVICINIFGERKLETVRIPTNVNADHIKTIAFCIQEHLKVPVIPGKKHIKITNVTSLIKNVIDSLPTIHSTELINYLTGKERKDLTKGVLS